MPHPNLPTGTSEEKQNQVRMFQWRQDRDVWRLKCADGSLRDVRDVHGNPVEIRKAE